MNFHSDHLDARQIRAWVRKELPPGELLDLSDHVSECSACREKLQSDRPKLARLDFPKDFAAPPDSNHLSDEELSEYVKAALPADVRQRAERHLKNCATCRFQADELIQFKETMAGYMARRYEPAPRVGWISRLQSHLAMFTSPARLLVLSGAAMALFLVVFIAKNLLPTQRATEPAASFRKLANLPPVSTGDSNSTAGPLAALDPGANPQGIPEPPSVQSAESRTLSATVPFQLSARAPSSSPDILHDGHRTIKINGNGDPEPALDEIAQPWKDWVRHSLSTGIVVIPQATRQSPSHKSHESIGKPIFVIPQAPRQWPQDVGSLKDPAEIAQVRSAEKNAAGSHLVKGVVYAHFGLLSLAQKEFRSLVEENPQSPLAMRLLQQVSQ